MPVVGFKGELKLVEELFTTEQDDDRLIESSVANIDLIPNTPINYMDEKEARNSKGYVIEEMEELFRKNESKTKIYKRERKK